MRGLPILLVAVVPVLSGCNLFKLAAFNAQNEPHMYQNQEKLKKRAVEFAEEAWANRLSHMKTDSPPPKAFECGYIDGFADYLFLGGNGSPPAIPPPYLRRYQYLSPEGHTEIEDYYAGFAAGAADAKASGQRIYFTVPISSQLQKADKLLEQATETDVPIREELPTPKEAPKEAEGGTTRVAPALPPAVVVSSPRVADATPAPPRIADASTPHVLDAGPAHPELLRPPQGNSTIELPVGPANTVASTTPVAPTTPVAATATVRDKPDQALPREFMLPILGGAGSR